MNGDVSDSRRTALQFTPSVAAAKASFSTASAYRIESDPRPPSQKQTPRSSRRRDPLDGVFEKEVVPLLVECPALRAVTIFEELRRRDPQLPASVRRTLERRVRRWRALHGPEQEVRAPRGIHRVASACPTSPPPGASASPSPVRRLSICCITSACPTRASNTPTWCSAARASSP